MAGMDNDDLQLGQRVWVLDPDATGGKAWGRLSAVDHGFGFLSGERFVAIVLDGGTIVVNCVGRRRGVQWDLASLDVPVPALHTASPTSPTSNV